MSWEEPTLMAVFAALTGMVGLAQSRRERTVVPLTPPAPVRSPGELEAWLDALDVGVCVVDDEDRLVAWNLRWTEWFPVHLPPEASGLDIALVLEDLPGVDGGTRRALRDALVGHGTGGMPLRIQVGSRALVGVARPLRERLTLWTFRDQTQQARITAERDRLRAELDALVYGATHELRRPLVQSQGLLSEARELAEQPDLNEVFDDLQHRLQEADALVVALVELASLAPVEPRVQPVDMDRVVDQALLAVEEGGTTGALRLIREWEVPVVWADRDRLTQVMSILLSNVDRHRLPGQEVATATLRSRSSARGTEIIVCDDGPGVDSTVRAHVFELFVRRGNAPGAGLGLFRARRLVEDMRGHIALVDGDRGGAQLVVELPALRA